MSEIPFKAQRGSELTANDEEHVVQRRKENIRGGGALAPHCWDHSGDKSLIGRWSFHNLSCWNALAPPGPSGQKKDLAQHFSESRVK